jgi:hypothetical protein
MLIENLNELIQPYLACHPLRLGASMVSNQIGKWTPTGSNRRAWSREVQRSDMDDDCSSEGNFILASPTGAFKVFGTAWLARGTLIGGSNRHKKFRL